MKYNYPHISRSLAGDSPGVATITSTIIHKMIQDPLRYHSRYPQRIPRTGFFDELSSLETDHFRSGFDIQIKKIKKALSQKMSPVVAIKYLEIALRLGVDIREYYVPNIPLDTSSNDKIHIEYLFLLSSVNRLLSSDEEIPSSIVRSMHKIGLCATDEMLKATILLQAFVISCRYLVGAMPKKFFEDTGVQLRACITVLPDDISGLILKSMIFRGVCMSPGTADQIVESDLQCAVQLAKKAMSDSVVCETDLLVAKENLHTLYQSCYRWKKMKGNSETAVLYLNKMLDMDPLDNIPLLELALNALEVEDFFSSINLFNKVIELGPPGLSMCYFYRGIAHDNLRNEKEAVDSFRRSFLIDPTALSSVLELVRIYSKSSLSEALYYKKIILENADLRSQLDEEEMGYLCGLK